MLQPNLGALGPGRVWRGEWERRALLGAWRTSGNLGLVVSNSSSSSPLPSGRPWLCGPGVLGAEGGVGSTWCARGSHRWKQHKSVPWGGSKRQGTPSPRSGLSWVLPRLSSHFFKASRDPHPTATTRGEPGCHSSSESIPAVWP